MNVINARVEKVAAEVKEIQLALSTMAQLKLPLIH